MIGSDAILSDGITMFFCGITFVTLPVVVGKLFCQAIHIIIAIGLGQNAGSSNGEIFAITFHDGGGRQRMIRRETISVDNNGFWAYLQLIQSTVHSQDRGTQNIDTIDFLRGDDTHRPGNGFALNHLTQCITSMFCKLFRVIKFGILIVRWQDNGRCIDTACQTSTACLVAARFYQTFIIMTF